MSKIDSRADANSLPRQPVEKRSICAIAFNVGLATFLVDGFWRLVYGPFVTSVEYRLHTLFLFTGLLLAIIAWIYCSCSARWLKASVTVAAVGVILFMGIESVRQFDIRERELSRGAVVNGRVIYRELGLSFEVPSNWQLNLQPFVVKPKSNSERRDSPLRIRYGESAVFFQAYPQIEASKQQPVADSIQIEGGPFVFRSLGRTLGSVRQLEASYQAMKNVRIVRPTHFHQLGGIDFAEFDLIDESKRIYYRHLFARCGENRLDFVLTTSGSEPAPRFVDFTRSIRITRTPTRFND